MKKTILTVVCFFLLFKIIAQDIHFSQFNNTPLLLNPALTGAFDANHRIIGNYKSQWRNVDRAYLTYGFSYDMGILKGKLGGGLLGLGLQFFNDHGGINKMNLTQANVSVAYHLPLNKKNFLTAGIQGGWGQRRIDESKMQWDNQYDPSSPDGFNPALPSGEQLQFMNKNFGDFSAGLLWSFNSNAEASLKNDAKKVQAGVALFHVNRPKQSLFNLEESKLYMKIVVHVNSFIGFSNSSFSLQPSAVWYNQGPSNYILFGSYFRYRLNEASKYTNFVSETAFALGCHYRYGDAVIIGGQFEWKNFMLGVSYDVNVSGFTKATKGAGGMEIALRYITPLFSKDNKSLF